MDYIIQEVDGPSNADTIHAFNRLSPEIFPELELRHFTSGFWWLAYAGDEPIGFAGLVPFLPRIGYLKRCLILHRGHGLQYRLMMARIAKAKSLQWTHIVSECDGDNSYSASNFHKAGFETFNPEQRWGRGGSLYWIKSLA